MSLLLLCYHIEYHLDGFLHRVPAAEKMEVRQLFTGPECFTPDANFIFGEAPEVYKEYNRHDILSSFDSLTPTCTAVDFTKS